jgi:uncharacterized protein YjbI with pentapeptide repeats
LSEAVFTDSDLSASQFFKADLSQADFRGARNYMLVPGQCKLAKARFSYPEVMALLSALDIVIGG